VTVLYWGRLVVPEEGSEGRGKQGGTAVNQRGEDNDPACLESVIILLLLIGILVVLLRFLTPTHSSIFHNISNNL
jgi:hypothetical protein